MLDDLRDLYQEVILDHGRRPRNFRRLENATHHAFRQLAMTGQCPECEAALAEDMERLSPLSGVHEFPSRVKCATLAWHTLNNALDDSGQEARSE